MSYNVSKIRQADWSNRHQDRPDAKVTAAMVPGSDTFKFDLTVEGVLVNRFDTIEEAVSALRRVGV